MRFKFSIIFIVIYAIFFQGCKSKKVEIPEVAEKEITAFNQNRRVISFRRINLDENEQLLRDLNKYFDTIEVHYQREVPKVFQLVLEPNEFESSFRITPIYHYSEFCYNVPSGYFQLEDKVILVYTGLEIFSSVDSVFFYELNKLVNKELVKDVDLPGNNNGKIATATFWHPEAWQFKVLDKDSIIINKQVSAPNRIKTLLAPPLPNY